MANISLTQKSDGLYDPNRIYGNYSANEGNNNKNSTVNSVNSVNPVTRVKGSGNVEAVKKQSVSDKVSSILAESAKAFVSGVKTNSDILLDALKNMNSADSSSAVNKVVGTPNNSEVMTATNSVSKSDIDSTEPIGVNIHQVATTQKNGANTALAANRNDFSPGHNRFAVDVGNKSYNFSFHNDEKSTNLSIQQRMADSINKKNIGLNAHVSYDEETKKSTLTVESSETGKNERASSVFAVRDVAGNAARTSGIDTITQDAQNAKYSINGYNETLTSRSNTVKIAAGVTATLRKATAENNPVTVEINKDTTGIMNAARNVVNGYNKLYDTAKSSNDTGAAKFASSLASIAKTSKSSLDAIGISINSESRLKIDDVKLKDASENGKLESFFNNNSRGNSGFVNKLERFAAAASENPAASLSSRAKSALADNASYRANNTNESSFKNVLNITFNPRSDYMMAAGSFYESAF